jgi:hypothetical protein
MADKRLDFYQIYYKDGQESELYPFAIPFRNEVLTHYFENSIIARIVPETKSELVSICSWMLRKKRGQSSTEILLKRQGMYELTEERILQSDYDIAVLTPRSPTHKPLAMARNWHGQAWVQAFDVLKRFLHTNKLCKVPDELTNTIYENHFIAKGEIYRQYVSECLIPVIQFIESEGGVFLENSGYLEKCRFDQQKIKEYQRVSGRVDWPIAPFILERLFSIWIEYRKYKVIPL